MTTICKEAPTTATLQKLSALMRRGAELSPEYREAYAGIVMPGDLTTLTIGTCPLGAAYHAATGLLPHDEMNQSEMYQVLYQATGINLFREYLHLQQVYGDQLLPEKGRGSVRLDLFINHLSLELGLSREQIADFLESAEY